MKSGVFFLMLTAFPVLAQMAPGVEVLKLDVQSPEGHPAKAPLLISYGGGDLGPDVYVRVFRGSKRSLAVDMPSHTRDGECVLYNSTVPIAVGADGKMLHVDGLVQFFDIEWRADHQINQTFTLVFERGDHNTPDGHLRLAKSDVPTYFKHAVEWTLNATGDMLEAWHTQQAEKNPGVMESLLHRLTGPFTPPPVMAASRPSTPPAPPPPAVAGRVCQSVKQVALLEVPPTGLNDIAADATTVPLDPNEFAVRSAGTCGD
jgi:hypothetical protein